MNFQPRILGFFCHWCCYAAADAAGVARFQYPPNIRVIRIMCTGRIDPIFLVDGFINRADAIFVGGWHLGECHYRTGNYEAINKVKLVARILQELKVNPERLSLEWVSAAEGPRYVQLITEFTDRMKRLGPLGSSENLYLERLMIKLRSVKMALEGNRLRMVIAKQAKYMKEGDQYREIPNDHKLHAELQKVLTEERLTNEFLLYVREKPQPVDKMAEMLGIPSDSVIRFFQKLEKRQLIEPDRLMV